MCGFYRFRSCYGTTIAEEEDDPIRLKYRKNRTKAVESEKNKSEPAMIKHFHVTYHNLHAVRFFNRTQTW